MNATGVEALKIPTCFVGQNPGYLVFKGDEILPNYSIWGLFHRPF